MHEVAETSRNYEATPPHMSLVGGKFGQSKGGSPKVPLTPDRSGSARRFSANAHVKGVSAVLLSGRPRAIIPNTGSSLAVRNPM